MARGNDVTPGVSEFYCEVEGCEAHGERVEGSPVYHFVCRPHAQAMGLSVLEDYVPGPAPTRTMPVAVFDGFSDALGRMVRVAPLEQLIIALEDALVQEAPLDRVRELVAAMRTGAYAEPEQIPSVIAPGF